MSFSPFRNGIATSLTQFTTKYFADSVEWCPGSNLIACGNYQLEEKKEDDPEKGKPSRQGCIYLMEAMDDNSLSICDQVETRGILDQKWVDSTHLGVVTSIGELVVYELNEDEKKLKELSKVSLDESEETIALSLDHWYRKTLVSDSKGNISIFDEELKLMDTYAGHGFEAWTCVFDRSDPNVFYSGEI